MNESMQAILKLRIDKTRQALERNNMQTFYAQTKEEVLPIVQSLLKPGDTVAVGGSVTLEECGILPLLRNGNYCFLDRYAPGLDDAGRKEIFRASFSADCYFCSANAITEQGELYNVDGNSNRVAALLYGPDSVIVVAGYNKIVADIHAAAQRVKRLAAPANAVRLGFDTYCAKAGQCISGKKAGADFCDGCDSDKRVCCNYVVCAHQRVKNRIKVILVGEPLGY